MQQILLLMHVSVKLMAPVLVNLLFKMFYHVQQLLQLVILKEVRSTVTEEIPLKLLTGWVLILSTTHAVSPIIKLMEGM